MINVLMSSDDNYIEQTITSLNSFFKFNKNNTIYFVYSNLSKDHLRLLCEFVFKNKNEIITIPFSESKINEFKTNNYPPEAAYRLFCLDYLPGKLNRILWLDSDTIIQANLDSFYNSAFEEDKAFIGCNDVMSEEGNDRLGRPKGKTYINSGVLLINLAIYRKLYNKKFIIESYNEHKNICLCPDQDLINMLYSNNIQCVSAEKYNLMACRLSDLGNKKLTNLISEASIIHFTGARKQTRPWNKSFSGHKILFDTYFRYVDVNYAEAIMKTMKKSKYMWPMNRLAFLLKELFNKIIYRLNRIINKSVGRES